jgi:hypothetical protein
MSSALKRKLKNKKAPEGWSMIEEVIEDFEQQMKDAVADEAEGKRKCEASWKIHRIHWEKNRFIYDLMYVRKVMSRELVSNQASSYTAKCLAISRLAKWFACRGRLPPLQFHSASSSCSSILSSVASIRVLHLAVVQAAATSMQQPPGRTEQSGAAILLHCVIALSDARAQHSAAPSLLQLSSRSSFPFQVEQHSALLPDPFLLPPVTCPAV